MRQNKNNLPKWFKVVGSIIRARFFSRYPSPVMLSYIVTEQCNAHCPFCFWKYPKEQELNTEEAKTVLIEAASLGIVVAGIWGGEPLLRPDIMDILKMAKKLFPLVVLYTNGYLLPDMVDVGKYTDIIFVSIDEVGDKHDKIRGLKGLYDRMVKGIVEVRKRYPNIRFMACCTLSKLNDGCLNSIATWGKYMDIPIFFGPLFCAEGPTINAPKKENVKKLDKTLKQYSYDFQHIKMLKKLNYPIANSYTYIDYIINGCGPYRCYWPQITLTIYSNGDIEDCRFYKGIFNIRDIPLKKILQTKEYIDFVKEARYCNYGCRGQDPVEASRMWALNLNSLINFLTI